jgi:hypothetical protein
VGWYDLVTGERVDVAGVLLDSTQDLLHLDATRLVRVATRLTLDRFPPFLLSVADLNPKGWIRIWIRVFYNEFFRIGSDKTSNLKEI